MNGTETDTASGGRGRKADADYDYVRAEKRLPREGEVERVTDELDRRRVSGKESGK